jgi:dTDP-glucose 4,6-dehydratase
MRRVVITGGAGFIGSHLCRRFLADGWKVVCIDNFLTGRRENIEDLESDEGFDLLEQDVSDGVWYPHDVDAVLHFASPASPTDFERLPIQILNG